MRLPGRGVARAARLRAHAWLVRPTVVLMYHRIATPETDPWQLAVTPRHFGEHLEVVRRYGHPLTVRELTRRLAEGGRLRRGIVVTLDDGYADSVDQALPLLTRHDVPATVFVVAGCVDRPGAFWWDELERLILGSPRLIERLRVEIRGRLHDFELHRAVEGGVDDDPAALAAWRASTPPPTRRHEVFLSLYRLLRPLGDSERWRVLDTLAQHIAEAPPAEATAAALGADGLRRLARAALVEIGGHTVTHPQLSALPVTEQRTEIARGRELLRETTGRDVVSFAYPYGARSDYTAETVGLVREAGFAGACVSFPGAVTRSTSPWEIPRLHVADCDGDGLARRLSSWSADT